MLGGLTLYPQKLVNVPVIRGFAWNDHPAIVSALVTVEASLAGRGRVLLRASGTEPLLRVMVEGEDRLEVENAAEKLASVVRAVAE